MHEKLALPVGTAELPDTDDSRLVRAGYWAIAVGLGGFMSWAAFAPLDQGVPGTGVVTVIDQRRVIQHPDGGLVEEVLVKEGERVREGQTLVRLESSNSNAQAEMLRAQYRAVRSEEERLKAELSGKKMFTSADASDTLMSEALHQQADLMHSNRALLDGDLYALNEAIGGLERQAATYRTLLASRMHQSELSEQQLASLRKLTEAGYYPKSRLLEFELNTAEQSTKVSEAQAQLAHIESSITDLKLKKQLRLREFRQEAESRQALLRQESLSLKARLDAAELSEKNINIVSPATGVVVGLNFHGKGAVIPAGGHIADIVPDDEQLLVEAQFTPDMADDLHAHLSAEIRFTGIIRPDLPVIEGNVLTVSADRLIDQTTRQPYFLARIQISKHGLDELGKRNITVMPGMPVEVLIKTGERTLFNYLITPIKDRMGWAFIER